MVVTLHAWPKISKRIFQENCRALRYLINEENFRVRSIIDAATTVICEAWNAY